MQSVTSDIANANNAQKYVKDQILPGKKCFVVDVRTVAMVVVGVGSTALEVALNEEAQGADLTTEEEILTTPPGVAEEEVLAAEKILEAQR